MNKKHMSWLIVFGYATLSTLLLIVKGVAIEVATCIVYNCTAAFSALIWGGAITVARINQKHVKGFLWHCLLWFALTESLITLAR